MTVYLMISHSGTGPANLVRFFTRQPYSHVCYAEDASLSALYTFGRRYTRFFLPGGFIAGGIQSDFYKTYPHTRIRVYALEITAAQKALVDARLAPFLAAPLRYKYGMFNCVYQFFGIPRHRAHHFTCSQFVALLFEGILPFGRDTSLVRPMDFCSFSLPCVFEGTAEEYCTLQKTQEKEDHAL